MASVPDARSPQTREQIDAALAEYAANYTDNRWQIYLAMHSERYRVLISEALSLVAQLDREPPRLLVIGPRFEVDLLQRLLPKAVVDTLGINPGLIPLRNGGRHFEFSLADADRPERRPSLGSYDLILMAEVMEHIPMPPSTFLPWLASLLAPAGYLLVQTPNAVALPNRLRFLAGRQPFQPLSDDRAYPGHFREYTISELVAAGRAAGLTVAKVRTANYFMSSKQSNRLFHRLERLIPATLRAGITVVYRSMAGAGQ